ncbi:ribonuclease III [Candidatus Riesia pediculischaeffi]|uniref:Ribonuclease 3 n=1 Tax=Candidatus Riesia pediculischaeffi PTSU TaxID=1401651 RepID=A0A0C1VIX4_9ENTR|nr:ribonuclease III [Candidatus Riesia pediculischaeffi]KIE63745.1 Ribonuclease III [Candidatus Riesia pediculischaeffi PTSU]
MEYCENEDVKILQDHIGYKFNNLKTLYRSLTHRSASFAHNERLEFLGDSVLNLIVTNFLYKRHPTCDEGRMSRIRSNLVKKNTLSEIAMELKIWKFIKLGSGEFRNQGFLKRSILSDTLEAVVGAIFLDSNSMKETEITVLNWYHNRMDPVDLLKNKKDPKTELQEYLQKLHLPLPKYRFLSSTGHDHEKKFTISCQTYGFDKTNYLITVGIGKNCKEAEQSAAKDMFEKIINRPPSS